MGWGGRRSGRRGSDAGTRTPIGFAGRGWRIAKILPDPGHANKYLRTDYYYNESWQTLEERTNDNLDSGDTVATAVNVQWLWDIRYIDAPVLRWRSVQSTLDETLYYCNDANMNVTALVSTSGTVVERYMYSPYGQPEIYNDSWTAVAWANSKKNEILYCGYRWDPETGMYQVRNREYHPTVGRWVQRDALEYADGMSQYWYCRGAPVNVFDPTGMVAPGTIIEDVRIRHKTDETWQAARDRNGSNFGAYGLTTATVEVTVLGKPEPPSPNRCSFTIRVDLRLRIDIPEPGVKAIETKWYKLNWPETMTIDRFSSTEHHESLHRTQYIAVWQRYIDQLAPSGSCCYERGLAIFRRDEPQDEGTCTRSANRLATYLADTLKQHLDASRDAFDSRANANSDWRNTSKANEAVEADIRSMKMRDWDCGDTVGWFSQ